MPSRPPNDLLYLTRKDVISLCGEIDPVAVAREVFSEHGLGNTALPAEAYLSWQTSRGDAVRSLNMPGYLGGTFGLAGTKIINSNPANLTSGLSRASGLILLFDLETARIVCVMEGTVLSALRTAAVSVLAIDLLSCPQTKAISVIGAGVIGRAHLQLALRSFPSLERALLYDINPAKANALADEARQTSGRPIQIVCAINPEDAVRAADVVITATTVTAGYIPYSWLKRGALVVNVSLDDVLPDVFTGADLLFVDDWSLVCADHRRVLGRLHQEGKIAGLRRSETSHTVRSIDGEISDLVLGRHPGRRRTEEIVVVNPFGMSIQDLALASLVFKAALERGLGMCLSA